MSPQRVTSRLAQREQQKMLRQTVLFFAGALIVIGVFIFLILPSFIRIINAVFGGPESVTVADTLPPQIPVITAPVEATFSAQLAIKGFAEPQSKVIAVVNGQDTDSVTAADDGSFEKTVDLTEGENSITLYAIDAAENESNTTKQYLVTMDTTKPELVVETPEDGQQIVGKNNQNLKVTGQTDPEAKVYVNDHLVFPDAEGAFVYSLRLNDGDVGIALRAVDPAGNVSEKSLLVHFTP